MERSYLEYYQLVLEVLGRSSALLHLRIVVIGGINCAELCSISTLLIIHLNPNQPGISDL
jgi:hypothetical protein